MSNPTLAPPTTSIQTINISTSELQRISILVYQYIRISVYQHFSHQYISTSAYQHHLFCYYFNISSPVLELFSGAARWRRLFSKQSGKQASKQSTKQTTNQSTKQSTDQHTTATTDATIMICMTQQTDMHCGRLWQYQAAQQVYTLIPKWLTKVETD